MNLVRDSFRVRGDTVDIIPASSGDKALRVEFFGDEIDRVSEINVVTGELLRRLSYAAVYPATHYAVSDDQARGGACGDRSRNEGARGILYRRGQAD